MTCSECGRKGNTRLGICPKCTAIRRPFMVGISSPRRRSLGKAFARYGSVSQVMKSQDFTYEECRAFLVSTR